MKLKQALSMVGIKKKPRTFGFEIRRQSVRGTNIEYAQWLHPRSYDCRVKESELKRLEEFLRPGDIAIDIGAHMGDTTLPMALCVGTSGKVLAFEPNAFVFPVLQRNASLNSESTSIEAYQLAITEEERELSFSYGDPGFMNGGSVEKTRWFRWGNAYTQTVQGIPLDSFIAKNFPTFEDKIRYVKIDAEGYDYFVLRSMPSVMQKSRPYLQLEIMRGTPRSYRDAIYETLTSANYKIHQMVSERPASAEMAKEAIYATDNFDLFCVPQ